MLFIISHFGMFEGVTFSQLFPPSFVKCINPSSLPTQINPSFIEDSLAAKIVQ